MPGRANDGKINYQLDFSRLGTVRQDGSQAAIDIPRTFREIGTAHGTVGVR
jgi:hypothetical protein